MILENFILSGIGIAAYTNIISKVIKTNLNSVEKDEIVKGGLYHFTSSKEMAEKIIDSQYLKAATGLSKNLNSWGRAGVYLFKGAPNREDYMINLDQDPYLNPTKVLYALKMDVKSEELKNYKIRSLNDNAIKFTGYCILPKDRTTIKKMVMDLARDDNGNPLINPKTGKYYTVSREAKEEEISINLKDNTESFIPSKDYLDFIEEEKNILNYNSKLKNLNYYKFVMHGAGVVTLNGINGIKKIPDILRNVVNKNNNLKLDKSIEDRLDELTDYIDLKNKNPYRDKKFALSIADLQKNGIEQQKLNDVLEKFNNSKVGVYFSKRDKQFLYQNGNSLENKQIQDRNRIALLGAVIAKKEMKNISKTHIDIITAVSESLNTKNKMKSLYMNGFEFSDNDNNIKKAIIKACKLNGKKFNEYKLNNICEKFNIPSGRIEETINLMKIMKDANSLNNIKNDVNLPTYVKTNLNINSLNFNTSKSLINASYQLEALTEKIPSFQHILSYKTENLNNNMIIKNNSERDSFIEYLKKDVPNIVLNKALNVGEKSIKHIRGYSNSIKTNFKGVKSRINDLVQKKQMKNMVNNQPNFER